jgi:hypothetical protein
MFLPEDLKGDLGINGRTIIIKKVSRYTPWRRMGGEEV